MKKIILFLFSILVLTGCTLFAQNASPTRMVENFLSNYQTLNKVVVTQLDDVIANQQLTASQKDKYKNVIKNQYKDLTYTIKDEAIDSNNAVVTVSVEVYNLYKAQTIANEYANSHPEDFKDEEGNFSEAKFIDYKIEQLKDTKERIKYNLDLKLTKVNNNWNLDDLSISDREKLNGVYNNL